MQSTLLMILEVYLSVFQAVYRSGIEARHANEEVLLERLRGSERGMALVSWDVVCQPTSQGGLKVLHLYALNPRYVS